jgi:predicted dehydrogenase
MIAPIETRRCDPLIHHPAPDAAIGIAVIGAGYWGPNLVRNFMGSPSFHLRWLCDLDRSRAEQVLGQYTNVRVCTDYVQILADPSVQAVAVATPAGSHLDIALAALRAGKHVLVEKPMAATYEAGKRLVGEAERRGLTLMCDHTYCYTPVVSRIRKLLHSGDLGEIQYLDAVRINLGLVQRDIDVLWDLAPHDLSILIHILPNGIKPVDISAVGIDPIGVGRCCVAYLNVNLSNGAIAHIHVNWLSPIKVRTVIIGGSKRTLVWDDVDSMYRLSIFDRRVDVASSDELDADLRRSLSISHRLGDMIAPAIEEREALQSVVAEFARAILTATPAMSDGRSGLAVLRLLEAASQSLNRAGARIELDA